MKLFGPMYERTLRWARHRNATWLLAFLSFIEAIFFPIPPEVMLAPMCLSQPRRGFWFATISLASAMVGAVVSNPTAGNTTVRSGSRAASVSASMGE